MTKLIGIYFFLLIFRPYEYWTFLGDLHFERIYMILLLGATLLNKRKMFEADPIIFTLLGFLTSMAVSSALAIDTDLAFTVYWKYIKSAIFFFVLVINIRTLEDFREVVFAYLLVMLLYVGKSMWEYFFHNRHVYRMGIRRLIGIDQTYSNPNGFAASVSFSLPFIWCFFQYQYEQRWKRYVVYSYAVIAPVAIVLTGSRSGLVTMLLFSLFMLGRTRKKIMFVLLVPVLMVAGWQFVPESLQLRFWSLINPDVAPQAATAQHSAEGRIEGLLHGIEVFKQYPVFGVGPYNFHITWSDGTQPHNLVGQVLSELGFVGTFMFCMLTGMTYFRNRRIVRAAEKLQRLMASVKASVRASASGNNSFTSHAATNTPTQNNSAHFNVLTGPARFVPLCAIAVNQSILLMLFNGNFSHNLYRYSWLVMAAFAVLALRVVRLDEAFSGGPAPSSVTPPTSMPTPKTSAGPSLVTSKATSQVTSQVTSEITSEIAAQVSSQVSSQKSSIVTCGASSASSSEVPAMAKHHITGNIRHNHGVTA